MNILYSRCSVENVFRGATKKLTISYQKNYLYIDINYRLFFYRSYMTARRLNKYIELQQDKMHKYIRKHFILCKTAG